MKNKTKITIALGILISLLLIPTISSIETDTTSLEIIDIRGGVGGIIVDVENTGDVIANDVWVITTITGGILGKIDITHECTGCSVCGTTLDPGAIKSENSLEAAFLFGFGPIEITTSAGAANANQISSEKTGFAIGPLVIIN
jgi:hypothetical protein